MPKDFEKSDVTNSAQLKMLQGKAIDLNTNIRMFQQLVKDELYLIRSLVESCKYTFQPYYTTASL